jgi:hypothetical protein
MLVAAAPGIVTVKQWFKRKNKTARRKAVLKAKRRRQRANAE